MRTVEVPSNASAPPPAGFVVTITTAGFAPGRIHTTATVHLEAGPTIARIELVTEASVPGLDDRTFQEKVEASKRGCPVSKALASVPVISVTARLV